MATTVTKFDGCQFWSKSGYAVAWHINFIDVVDETGGLTDSALLFRNKLVSQLEGIIFGLSHAYFSDLKSDDKAKRQALETGNEVLNRYMHQVNFLDGKWLNSKIFELTNAGDISYFGDTGVCPDGHIEYAITWNNLISGNFEPYPIKPHEFYRDGRNANRLVGAIEADPLSR